MANASFDQMQAARFARLALDCVHKQYPNKIAHSLNSDADVKPPRELTPAFYGCYDWHSSVHGHWLLVRLVRLFPDATFAADARRALAQSLTPANLAQEVKYLETEGRGSFERPYGLAWLLQLSAELREFDDPEAHQWSAALLPLEKAVTARIVAWLPKMDHPIRTGEHNNTAFSMGLMIDYARVSDNAEFGKLVESRARDYYLKDKGCPLNYEPSGEDFLSPCLAEADVVRRLLPAEEFARWLTAFLPRIDLEPTHVADPSDGKLYHLAGLNLSRAWMLEGIGSKLPPGDKRRAGLTALADRLAQAGLDSIKSEHYEGGHWLGSFAVYLVSHRGHR
ncbi:MAG: hypothetical protein JWP63_2822 [Candidatus Solibacter sp.]|nr:hypothetical protein [Candidatus Solibacter sp.]